jgi:hypothetical protein
VRAQNVAPLLLGNGFASASSTLGLEEQLKPLIVAVERTDVIDAMRCHCGLRGGRTSAGRLSRVGMTVVSFL